MPATISVITTTNLLSIIFRLENSTYDIHLKNTRLFKLKLKKFLQNLKDNKNASVVFINYQNDYVKFDHKMNNLIISSDNHNFKFEISGKACNNIFTPLKI
jgi:hypothetical protein